MKFMFLKSHLEQTIASIVLMSIVACSPSQRSTTPNPVSHQPATPNSGSPSQKSTTPNPVSHQSVTRRSAGKFSKNLIALLVVKKDNIKNEFRGEIYPIALLSNDRYLKVNNDVTQDIRNNGSRDRILQLNAQRIVTNVIKNFTVISNNQKLGEFQIEKPIVSQFYCSSIITGQGNFQGQTSLPAVFKQIPQERSSGFKGMMYNQEFDETWRSAIAISQPPTLSRPPAVSEADLVRYRQAALTFGRAAIAKVANGVSVPGEAVVESMQVVDLDHDGSPEIFSKVRQGNAANTKASPQGNSSQDNPTGFAAVWFTERAGQPQRLETTQAVVRLSGSQRFPYDLLGAIDINGDGTDELIVESTGHESTSFEIYKYQNNQLNRVFNGAGYGC